MPDRGKAILEAKGLVVRRGQRELVRLDHLALRPAELRVLLGPNGAGKTTLLKALNGLEHMQGTLYFQDKRVRSAADRLAVRRHTGMVFQQPFLLSTTVRGNVEAGLRNRGVKGEELHRRTDEALELLGISHLAGRRRAGLSGGEAQRVSIARALAPAPSILFLDEPMASLDPPTRRSLLGDLQRILRHLSTSVLWVTHDTEEALSIADHISFLFQGRLLQEGPPNEFVDAPATSAVADYLGIGAWLQGIVVPDGGSTTRFVLANGATLLCSETASGPALACIHPEDVLLKASVPEASRNGRYNVLVGIVQGVRARGRFSLVTLQWEGGRLEAMLTRAAFEELDTAPRQSVYAVVRASAVQVVRRSEHAPEHGPQAEPQR
jgi:tungstate transport system ATP-binding protein